VKERLSEELQRTQEQLSVLQIETEELRKESKRMKQRIKHRDDKLLLLAKQGAYTLRCVCVCV
jgi:hypothetical protein